MLETFEKISSFDTTTPDHSGCLDWVAGYVSELGFEVEWFNSQGTRNLYAKKMSGSKPIVLFSGHSDTVSIGDEKKWKSNPFQVFKDNDQLIARGAVDMKGAVAAMLESFRLTVNDSKCSVAILLTSNEEGYADGHGTAYAVECLKQRQEPINWIINGEPTSQKVIGDCVKTARRGSLTVEINAYGKQGHVAYPELAINPNNAILDIIHECYQMPWGRSLESDSNATSFQVVGIQSGTGFDNVIPGQAIAIMNWRYTTDFCVDELQHWFKQIIAKLGLSADVKWRHSAQPYRAKSGRLLNVVHQLLDTKGIEHSVSSSGGTSDARYLVNLSDELIELGLLNHTAHHINECTTLSDLKQLTKLYMGIIQAGSVYE